MLDYEEVINHTDSNTHDNAILNMPSTDTAETIKTIEDVSISIANFLDFTFSYSSNIKL